MAIGPTLKEARLKKKLTTSQVGEMTRVKMQIIDDLENDDFHRIAAPIYGKGFIKLIAACLDLDPVPLIADYTRTVSGVIRHETPSAREESTDQEPARVPAASAPAEVEAPTTDLFEFANSRRRRISPAHSLRPAAEVPVSPPAPAAKPEPVLTRHHTRSERRTIAATIRNFLKPLRERVVILANILKNRLANLKWSDRMLKPVGIVLAALVVLLVLVSVIRFLATRVGPRPPADHELLLFIPPPEPYVE